MPQGLNNLPRVLRQWRKQNGIKQAVAASAVGVSSATWGHWEVGIRFPSSDNLLALTQYTKIPIQVFFGVAPTTEPVAEE